MSQYAIDEQVTLLEELNHRLFNTLQVVSRDLALCANATQPALLKSELVDLHHRLGVFAALHRMAAHPPCGDLEDHCRAVCMLLVGGFGRLNVTPWVSIQSAGLGRREEQIITLLVIELVTNVLKHSLVGDDAGVVWVELRPVHGKLELSVCDNHKTPIGTFGPCRMVEALAHALEGEVIVCDRGGLTVVVRFPEPAPTSVMPPGAALWESVRRPVWRHSRFAS